MRSRLLIIARGFIRQRGITDALSISQIASRILQKSLTAQDALVISQLVQRVAAQPRQTLENLFTSESVVELNARVRAVADALAISEFALPRYGRLRLASDSLVTGESVVRLVEKTGSLLNRLPCPWFRSNRRGGASFHRSPFDERNKFASKASVRLALDLLAISEAAVRTSGRVRTALDHLTLVETIARLRFGVRFGVDHLTLVEALLEHLGSARFTLDHLFTSELGVAVPVTGYWDYLLPFPEGNSPVESDIRHLGWVRSQYVAGWFQPERATGRVDLLASLAISNLINVTADGNLECIEE
jgi:hypothetical protein